MLYVYAYTNYKFCIVFFNWTNNYIFYTVQRAKFIYYEMLTPQVIDF
jgi:hypothetical protein